MGDELKPCPFCGASNTYIESGLLDGRYSEEKWFQVQCQECCAVGSSRSAECDAVEAWNNAGSARAEAAEKRAEALEREAAQARADRAVLAPVVLSLLGAQARHIVPADPMPLLMALRAQTLTLLGSHDNVDATNYLRAMFARLDAEAQPAREVSDG